VQRAKNTVLPLGPAVRTLPFGIGRGVRLEIDFRNWTKLYLGLYEVELNRHLRHLCRPGVKCFDVGGQLGYDALVLAKLSGAPVISFDCDPQAVAQMSRSFAANRQMSAAVEARQAFIGATNDRGSGRISLDDVAFGSDAFVPDLVKMDIEGAELEALKGASRLLKTRKPHLIVEVHSKDLELACGGLLLDAGYTPKVVSARRWLRDDRPLPHNRWLVAAGN